MVVSGNSYTGLSMTGSSQTTSGPATRVHRLSDECWCSVLNNGHSKSYQIMS